MNNTFLALGAALFIGIMTFVLFTQLPSSPPAAPEVSGPYHTILSGTQVCLPDSDPDNPTEDVCTFGLRTEAGKYYALDFEAVQETGAGFVDEEPLTASGLMTPLNLPDDLWQGHDVVGIFAVTSLIESATSSEPLPPPAPPTDSEPPIPLPPELLPVDPEPPVTADRCYVGGCSSQICSDQPDMMSTCEWRESYACYRTATCERQPSGQCGWTETPELRACISNAGSGPELQLLH